METQSIIDMGHMTFNNSIFDNNITAILPDCVTVLGSGNPTLNYRCLVEDGMFIISEKFKIWGLILLINPIAIFCCEYILRYYIKNCEDFKIRSILDDMLYLMRPLEVFINVIVGCLLLYFWWVTYG